MSFGTVNTAFDAILPQLLQIMNYSKHFHEEINKNGAYFLGKQQTRDSINANLSTASISVKC